MSIVHSGVSRTAARWSANPLPWALVLVLAFMFGSPTLGHAQSAIAGTVKDTSGALLPGVTVEAASPVLIEKSRTAVTDGQGQYKIIDLRPGTYTVTFTLAGFSTFKRDGIELPASFTATVNGEKGNNKGRVHTEAQRRRGTPRIHSSVSRW